MGKESFILYTSFYKPISILSDKQLGRLLRAMFRYNLGEVVSVEEDIRMAFEFFKNQFELDERKYQAKVMRDAENGHRGGNPNFRRGKANPYYDKAGNGKQGDRAGITQDNPPLSKITQDNPINENDNDNDNISTSTSTTTRTRTRARGRPHAEVVASLADDQAWADVTKTKFRIQDDDELKRLLAEFSDDCVALGDDHTDDEKGAKYHFTNWMYKRVDRSGKLKKQQQYEDNQQRREDRRGRFESHAASPEDYEGAF